MSLVRHILERSSESTMPIRAAAVWALGLSGFAVAHQIQNGTVEAGWLPPLLWLNGIFAVLLTLQPFLEGIQSWRKDGELA